MELSSLWLAQGVYNSLAMLFLRTTIWYIAMQAIIQLMYEYSECSGQWLNLAKSTFYVRSLTRRHIEATKQLLGFREGLLPFNYLGVPNFQGKLRKIYLQPIANKILSKLTIWHDLTLSVMGRAELVKSTIQGMLLYNIYIYVWPKNLLRKLDTTIRNFLWTGDIDKRKLVIAKMVSI